jgi:hypothetical protein
MTRLAIALSTGLTALLVGGVGTAVAAIVFVAPLAVGLLLPGRAAPMAAES